MNGPTDAVANASHIVCQCGRDHGRTGLRRCPIFNILDDLHLHIKEFLNVRDVWDFGKDGPFAYGLRCKTVEHYGYVLAEFKLWEAASKEHPEWHLQEQMSRLWEYFEQVADGCAEATKSLEPSPPASVVPKIAGNEEEALRDAKKATIECYHVCFRCVILNWIDDGACPLSGTIDDQKCLKRVDDAFKEASEKITLLPITENTNIKDLTNTAYGIWMETRRLLCESETRMVIP